MISRQAECERSLLYLFALLYNLPIMHWYTYIHTLVIVGKYSSWRCLQDTFGAIYQPNDGSHIWVKPCNLGWTRFPFPRAKITMNKKWVDRLLFLFDRFSFSRSRAPGSTYAALSVTFTCLFICRQSFHLISVQALQIFISLSLSTSLYSKKQLMFSFEFSIQYSVFFSSTQI